MLKSIPASAQGSHLTLEEVTTMLHNTRPIIQAFGLIALLLTSELAALAGDTFYLGRWKITSAVVAPWADENVRKPDTTEMKSLVGRLITIEPKAISGPRALACIGPKYQIKDYPADMLFQGAFGEMHERDKSVSPARLAEKIGFRGSTWKTLETGCAVEIDYHFMNPDMAAFGLNDFVYILKKQP